jgi:SAM-dependent methyltransferase
MKKIIDVTCGSKMMWFDKNHPEVIYTDKRKGRFEAYGKTTIIDPDIQVDFKNLPFKNEVFYLVVFDPPHSKWLNENTILGQKYGQLFSDWKTEIKSGFDECMRVLKPNGILIFKWNDKDIKLNTLLEVIGENPLFGHPTGKQGKTIWMTFMKKQNCLGTAGKEVRGVCEAVED